MSLMIVAPRASASRATEALYVSIESGTLASRARRSTTGSTRRISSSAPTCSAPGRVDSPPMSSMIGPVADHAKPCLDRAVDIVMEPAVSEGIGRDVEDAHDERALAEARANVRRAMERCIAFEFPSTYKGRPDLQVGRATSHHLR